MTAQFIVEDGSVVANANALVSVADADQIMENFGASTDWSGAVQAVKEAAIREATRFLDINYVWAGYKVDEDQTCQWPRYDMYDEDGYTVDFDIVHRLVKEACAYLALQVVEGDTLLEDFENKSKVKKTKDVIGPLTEEREYVVGETPEKTYTVVEKLITPFIINGSTFNSTSLERS